MKQYIKGTHKLDGRHFKLNQALKSLKQAWLKYANLDIEISDDSESITFENNNGDPVVLRIKIQLIPQYQIYNQYQDSIGVSTDLKEVESILSDEISRNR